MPKKKSPNVTLGKIFQTYFNLTFTSKVSRLPRCYYWIFSIFIIPPLGACGVMGMMGALQWSKLGNYATAIIMFLLSAAVLFVAFVSNFQANIARLHDSDHSGFFLLWGLVPYLGTLILFVVLGFYGSIQGKNEYGKPFDFDKLESLPPKK